MMLTTRRQIYGGEPDHMDMQPLDPDKQPDDHKPLSATLTAQQWNTVLALLFETAMPQRVSRPITDTLLRQLQPQLQPLSTSAAMQGLDAPP